MINMVCLKILQYKTDVEIDTYNSLLKHFVSFLFAVKNLRHPEICGKKLSEYNSDKQFLPLIHSVTNMC